ncbi:hypothetical protein [Thiohalobacter sp.]|uniref:hypothetical protein n=1 Tax=Thiohalobacter sp. TaxID=2025948 RepID=UPI002615240F|nr:hypothetical protein [Thiohalobacter sp.]
MLQKRFRRPDPMLLLAVAVGLGVVLTTGVQAAEPFASMPARAALEAQGARMALAPVHRLADRLELRWLEKPLDAAPVNELLEDQQLTLVPARQRRLGMSLSWREAEATRRALDDTALLGTGGPGKARVGLYLNIGRRW